MSDDSFEKFAADLEGISLADGIDEKPISATTLIEADEGEENGSSDASEGNALGVTLRQPPPAASFLDECSFVLPHFQPDVIQAFVLSKWDHILGPRAVHVWLLENPEETVATSKTSPASSNRSGTLEAVHYVVDHSLNASDAGEPSPTGAKSALFVVPRDNLVSFAVCFQIGDRSGLNHVAFSLSIIAESKWLDFISDVQHILQEALQIHAAKFRVYFSLDFAGSDVGAEWISAASSSLSEVCEMLSALKSHPVSNCLPLGSQGVEDGESKSGNVMNLMADKRFFERALTAHLQTGGRSLVIGSNEKAVASMLGILSLFLTKEERAASAGPVQTRKFFPLMHMQGYIVDPIGMNFIPAATLLESPAPLSIIDMNKTQVRQTALKHVHSKLHLVALKSSLLTLRDSQARATPVSEMILHVVRDGSPLVVNLVKEILKVPPVLWEYVIGLFMREIHWRAYALVQIVEDETNWISQDMDVGSAKQPMHKYLQSLVTGGVSGSSSPEDGDFLIILATADKLSPGIFNYVMNKKIAL